MFSVAAANLPLLKLALLFLLFIHLSFAGVIGSGCILSLLFKLYAGESKDHLRKLSRELLSRATLSKTTPILILASLLCCILTLQGLYPQAPSGVAVWPAVPLMIAGLGPIYFFRHKLSEAAPPATLSLICFFSSLLLFGSGLVLSCTLELLVRPEEWAHISGQPMLIFSWHGVAKWIQWCCLSGALTGGGIIFTAYRSHDFDEQYKSAAIRAGTTVSFICLLPWPPVLLFDIFNLPPIALSEPLFAISAGTLILACLIASLLLGATLAGKTPPPKSLLTGLVFFFVLWLGLGQMERETVFADQTILAGTKPIDRPAPVAETKAVLPTPPPAPTIDGKALFNQVCTACHQWDKRVVGPALNDVLPKYEGKTAELSKFIKNPVKINPDYPPMPNLGLDDAKSTAIAEYLQSRRK